MDIYHALINALSAHMIHINLNVIFYTHVEHSPTKTIYIKYYKKQTTPLQKKHTKKHTTTTNNNKQTNKNKTHTHKNTHTQKNTHTPFLKRKERRSPSAYQPVLNWAKFVREPSWKYSAKLVGS